LLNDRRLSVGTANGVDETVEITQLCFITVSRSVQCYSPVCERERIISQSARAAESSMRRWLTIRLNRACGNAATKVQVDRSSALCHRPTLNPGSAACLPVDF